MKKISAILLLLLCVSGVRAQTPSEKSLLWEISGKDLPAPSYLFGTIHLICPNDFELTDSLKRAFASTVQVALEMDMDDPGMMAAMTKTMFMNNGTTLKGLLSENEFSRLDKFYKDSRSETISLQHFFPRQTIYINGTSFQQSAGLSAAVV